MVWLINYVPNLIRKTGDQFKDMVDNYGWKTNTPEEYDKEATYGRGNRPSKLKMNTMSR